jgi:hypothetical protein
MTLHVLCSVNVVKGKEDALWVLMLLRIFSLQVLLAVFHTRQHWLSFLSDPRIHSELSDYFLSFQHGNNSPAGASFKFQ